MVANLDSRQETLEIKRRVDLASVVSQDVPTLKKSGSGWKGLCPFHADKIPSLTLFSDKDGVQRYKCQACGAKGTVVDWLIQSRKLDQVSAFAEARKLAGMDKPAKAREVATYNYCDEAGNLLYQAVRYEPKDFRSRRPDGAAGWIYNLEGVTRVPYRLPQLKLAELQTPVFVVEGEKDADNLAKAGLMATTSQGGAKNWREEYAKYFAQRNVIILPDNDDPGRDYAQKVLSSIHRLAASVKILNLEGLPEHGDVSDWLATGHTVAELLALANTTPSIKELYSEATAKPRVALPEILTAKELLAKQLPPQTWLVDNLIPDDGMAVLGGAAKVGKSYFLLNLGIAVATGGIFLGKRQCKQAGVLYLSLESNQRRDQNRLKQMLPNEECPDNFYIAWRWNALSQIEGGVAQIEQFLEDHPEVRLIIVDIMEAVRPAGRGRNAYTEDYAFLHPLRQLCFERHKQMIFSTHTNKGSWENPFDGFQNSTGIQGASSVNLLLKEKEGKHVLCVRGNDVEPQAIALEFVPTYGFFQELGDANQYAISDERKEILDLLAEFPKGLKPVEIASELGKYEAKSKDAVRQLLHTLSEEGIISRDENRKYFLLDHESRNHESQNHTFSPTKGTAIATLASVVGLSETREEQSPKCDSVIRDSVMANDVLLPVGETKYSQFPDLVQRATNHTQEQLLMLFGFDNMASLNGAAKTWFSEHHQLGSYELLSKGQRVTVLLNYIKTRWESELGWYLAKLENTDNIADANSVFLEAQKHLSSEQLEEFELLMGKRIADFESI